MLLTCCQTLPDFSSLFLPSGLDQDRPPTECHLDGTEQVEWYYTLREVCVLFMAILYFFLTEVVGAVVSVLIIWVITGVLFYEAVQRVIHPIEIDANIMLITACIGVFVNVL